MTHKPGIRVGAILSATEEQVEFLGWGVYDGMQPNPVLTARMRDAADAMGIGDDPIYEEPVRNPHITLDSGKEVWGFECWWGPEERVRAALGDRKVIEVDIDAVR